MMMKDMLAMLPGAGQLKDLDFDDDQIKQVEGIVHSMTAQERSEPDVIDSSRRRRIATGSGVQPNEVSGLVKTFRRSRDMLKNVSGGKLGALKSMFSGGFSMDSISSAMNSGRKIKQRSKRKKIIKRGGKIKRR